MEKKRLTAIKTDIKSVISGKYVVRPGFESNYVLTPLGMKLSRVRILATVVDKFMSESGKFASITLDDGTSTIRAKAFSALSIMDGIGEGDIVDVVGKVKEYQDEVYIMPEIIAKKDFYWEMLRALELKKQKEEWGEKRRSILENQKQTSDLEELKKIMEERFGISPSDVEAVVESQELMHAALEEGTDGNKSVKNDILSLISELDKGSGADYSEIIEKSGMAEDAVDSAINDLLEEGTCFEPKPGKIRKL